jgi:hypothetical protein
MIEILESRQMMSATPVFANVPVNNTPAIVVSLAISPGSRVMLNPQPLPPIYLNPQPLPP